MAKETEKKKQELVEQLTKTPIVQLACERCDVGRSTYYKWRKEDKIFGRTADHALEAGVFRVNDIAESKLLKLINDDNLTAIIFWLKHNHPKYANVNRVIHEYTAYPPDLSLEEKDAIGKMMARMIAYKNTPKFTAEEHKEVIEEELREDGDIIEYDASPKPERHKAWKDTRRAQLKSYNCYSDEVIESMVDREAKEYFNEE